MSNISKALTNENLLQLNFAVLELRPYYCIQTEFFVSPNTSSKNNWNKSSKMVMSGNSGQYKTSMAPQPTPEAASDEISKFRKLMNSSRKTLPIPIIEKIIPPI